MASGFTHISSDHAQPENVLLLAESDLASALCLWALAEADAIADEEIALHLARRFLSAFDTQGVYEDWMRRWQALGLADLSSDVLVREYDYGRDVHIVHLLDRRRMRTWRRSVIATLDGLGPYQRTRCKREFGFHPGLRGDWNELGYERCPQCARHAAKERRACIEHRELLFISSEQREEIEHKSIAQVAEGIMKVIAQARKLMPEAPDRSRLLGAPSASGDGERLAKRIKAHLPAALNHFYAQRTLEEYRLQGDGALHSLFDDGDDVYDELDDARFSGVESLVDLLSAEDFERATLRSDSGLRHGLARTLRQRLADANHPIRVALAEAAQEREIAQGAGERAAVLARITARRQHADNSTQAGCGTSLPMPYRSQ